MIRLLVLMILVSLVRGDEEYRFQGKHLVASYCECDVEALTDVNGLQQAMRSAVDECGACILDECRFVFPGNGLTMVFLLSESHASIHTYPEHRACFVDLFTCGDRCDHEKFDAALRAYLKPAAVDKKILLRNEAIRETE